MGWRSLATLAAALVAGAGPARADEGAEVVLVHNTALPASLEIATHYAALRGVPTNQIIGLELPTGETISRQDYRERLEKPLSQRLVRDGLLTPPSGAIPTNRLTSVTGARIRYLVLCHGVPLHIVTDAVLVEPDAGTLPEPYRRNEAAVDSELAALPLRFGATLLAGPTVNAAYACTNAADLHPTNGVLMVARLDGPTPEIARHLVDYAVLAERFGLWGRAYFDWRSVTDTNYQLGDEWIRGAAETVRRAGFETVVDDQAATFPASLPVSQVAFYAGWYDGDVSGPWRQKTVEFMPGAIAYHLHSFSAASLRTTDRHWVGPLLARGVTATVGYTAEPYLPTTLNLQVFWPRLVQGGYSFGEAAYAGLRAISWQTTVVGDPLYRPFRWPAAKPNLGGRLQELHEQLLAAHSPLVEWSHLQVVNLSLAMRAPPADMIAYLREQVAQLPSAVLQEKLGDLLDSQGKALQAGEAWERALQAAASPQQKLRLLIKAAGQRTSLNQDAQALALYEQAIKDYPDYADRLGLMRKALTAAESAGATEAVKRLREELKR